MIRQTNAKRLVYGETPVTYYEFSGNSDDDKPTDGVATGSLFLEVGTGKWYAYDEDDETWYVVVGGE